MESQSLKPNEIFCPYCGRIITPLYGDDGGRIYVHDDVPHPDDEDFTNMDVLPS